MKRSILGLQWGSRASNSYRRAVNSGSGCERCRSPVVDQGGSRMRFVRCLVSNVEVLAVLTATVLLMIGCGGESEGDSSRRLAPVFPFCAWPVESTPELANEAGPDPNATYWTTPFKTDADVTSITITGTYPT